MTVLREYHAELGQAITAYDGTIEHFAGDGAMIIFNAPLPVENHELKAVLMTAQIRDAVAALAASWKKRGYALGFGAGIAGATPRSARSALKNGWTTAQSARSAI
jgi:adenylate cyclase